MRNLQPFSFILTREIDTLELKIEVFPIASRILVKSNRNKREVRFYFEIERVKSRETVPLSVETHAILQFNDYLA